MGSEPGTSEGKIKVDEHYPSETDDIPPFDVKKIDNIRSNVKFDQCYEIAKHIGDGKFGKVFQVKDKSTGREYAAKFIKIRKEADRQEVEREVSILTQLRHPRIAQIYDAFYTTTNDVVLIMEIVRGGELFDRVADENYVLTEQAVAMIVCQLCEAISYIHQQNILHLDIKPENIMCVTQCGNRIKLIDFGLARYYDGTQELKYMAGTPEFAAPEVIKFEKLDYHTDMWSIGVITYILLSGYSPFLGDNLGETYCNVEKGVWEFTEEFDNVSAEAKDFISRLLIYDQRKRMLPAECLVHPWIAQQRAKAMIDANLEKPGEGPKIDNKMMMRYNAKRKFRPSLRMLWRMIIYVKFLIEMNRLRNSLRDRMSENGQKFFDPLLKMAEEKEKKVAAICAPLKNKPLQPQKLTVGNVLELAKEKKLEEPPKKVEERPPEKKEKRLWTREPQEPAPVTKPPKVKKTKTIESKTDSDSEKKAEGVKIVKKKSVKKTSSVDVEPTEKKEPLKKKNSVDTIKEKPKEEKKDAAKSPSLEVKRKKSSASDAAALLPPRPPSSKSPDLVGKSDKKTLKSEVSVDSIKEKPKEERKDATKSPSLEVKRKKSSAPDVAALLPPRPPSSTSPDLPARPDKKAQKSESSESTKENREVAEKKPARQGGIRKKEKVDENSVLNVSSIKKSTESLVSQTAHSKDNGAPSEAVVIKKKSSLKSSGEKEKVEQTVLDVKTSPATSRSGSLVKSRLTHLNGDAAPLTINIMSVAQKKSHDEKPAAVITMSSEKKTTTTTSTTTSIRKKSSTTEKKVQLTTDGKKIEQVEKTNSVHDKVKVSEVTTKKEESPELETPLTSVKKKVVKQNTLKSQSEKNRREEDKSANGSVVQLSKVVKDNTLSSVAVKEQTTLPCGTTKKMSLASTSEVNKKMEGKAEAEVTPKRTSLRKADITITKKAKTTVEAGINDRKASIQKSKITEIKITPDTPRPAEPEPEPVKEMHSTLKKRSSVLTVPKITSRESSEERKTVRFAGDVKDPSTSRPLMCGLQKLNSESCIPKKITASIKMEEKITQDDGAIRKKKHLLPSKSEDVPVFLPKEDFTFDSLREKLLRRVSDGDALRPDTRKECVPVQKTHSVKDRLRMFEQKK